jgi:diketogulonate reductase-like aldo/keto reductase
MNNSSTTGRSILHKGLTIPSFFYGTAWKEDQTEQLTGMALASGFLAIDTANQRRHYYEEGVGKAIEQALTERRLQRSDLFLQTKFTFSSSQDHRLPYEADADFASQVRQSLEGSLEHLGTSYLDSYLLHGPYSRHGLTKADKDVWHAMEKLQQSGSVRLIGVSNINVEQLQLLIEASEIKPAFVQNRCYASTKWDLEVRQLCRSHDIRYQGFSLLTANSNFLKHPEITKISNRCRCSTAQIIFRFALQSGMIALTGTSSQSHMLDDLAAYDIELSDAEMAIIENIAD